MSLYDNSCVRAPMETFPAPKPLRRAFKQSIMLAVFTFIVEKWQSMNFAHTGLPLFRVRTNVERPARGAHKSREHMNMRAERSKFRKCYCSAPQRGRETARFDIIDVAFIHVWFKQYGRLESLSSTARVERHLCKWKITNNAKSDRKATKLTRARAHKEMHKMAMKMNGENKRRNDEEDEWRKKATRTKKLCIHTSLAPRRRKSVLSPFFVSRIVSLERD